MTMIGRIVWLADLYVAENYAALCDQAPGLTGITSHKSYVSPVVTCNSDVVTRMKSDLTLLFAS